jgi:alpha-glucosidase
MFPFFTLSKQQLPYFFIFIFSFSFLNINAASPERTVRVLSPNLVNQIEFSDRNGELTYRVIHNGDVLINESTLGFEFKIKNKKNKTIHFNHSFCIEKSEQHQYHDFWKPIWGTDSLVENFYNESTIFISNTIIPDIQLKIIVRAYNDGVAFRYLLEISKTNKKDSLYIIEELTTFNFAQNDSVWYAPAADFAYESIYKKMSLSDIKNAATPITICRNNQLTISIHEAELINYSEFYLVNTSSGNPHFKTQLWPEPDGICVRIALPFQTPWRVIIIATNPGKLIESHLIQNLNNPSKIAQTEWIKPIKFIGIWWGMHTGQYTWTLGEKHGATTERTKKYIDFAAQNNIEGVLAEGWNEGWETWNSGDFPIQNFSKGYPDFNLQEVVQYGKSKQVHFVSHHETGGNIPEYERQLDSAFMLCNQLGIRYLKTGYAGKIIPKGYPHHGQYMVNHFQKVVEKAAQYHICLDVHESIKPTGLDRTWPNLMSQEAIRGNEWNGGYKPTPPSHTTILPFTRYIAGPADYTPGIFKTIHTPEKGKRLFTTRAHQMALMVVFFSPMAMVSDNIENYENQPEFSFISEVPSSWDASKVLSCQIGEYVSIARKKVEKWYIGTITNEKSRVLPIALDFLDSGFYYTVTIFGDGFENDWENNPDQVEIGTYMVNSFDSIMIPISQGSGNVMIIEKLDVNTHSFPKIKSYNISSYQKVDIYKSKKFHNLTQEIIMHKGYQSKAKYSILYDQKYCGDGEIGLTNGRLGTYNFFEEWQGFQGKELEIVIDLDTLKEIKEVEVRYMDAINDWIFAPKSVALWTSQDGINYEKVNTLKIIGNETRDYNIVDVKKGTFKFSIQKIRYIKIVTETENMCPEWHYGSGKSCWTFMDEVIVN